ncbi:MAG: NADH-quinone oxidoreductase subunit L [Anaerolineales bacterium]
MLSILTVLIIGIPWLGALCVWLIGDRRPRVLHALATAFALLAAIVTLSVIPFSTSQTVVRIAMGGILGDFTLIPDGLALFIAAIATVVGSAAVIFAIDYMGHAQQLARFYALVLFFIGAMAGLALSGSLLFTFFFWEITALCSYALISFHNDDPKAVSGGIKALIMTQLGGVGLLGGALLVYAYFGNYQISSLLAHYQNLPPVVLGLMGFGFLVAAAAKSAQVPFHSWLPDAMEAPTPVTALIHAATMVNAGVYLLARFYPAFVSIPGWSIAVMTVGVLSALLAGLMALAANDIKRVLAYSTISQLGYMFYAVGTGAIFASQFHLFSHAIFKALLFLSAGAVITALGTRDLRQMGGLGKRMPFLRIMFVIGALGLMGLPIANGFFSKELILESGLEAGPLVFYLIMLFSAGVTALYTIRLLYLIFWGDSRGPQPAHDGLPAMRVSLIVLAFGTLTTWLLAGGFSQLLASTLPFHHLEAEPTLTMVKQICLAPTTWIALGVIALGCAAWLVRTRFTTLAEAFRPVLEAGFGFDALNRQIVQGVKRTAKFVQIAQTGQLNWNVIGIVSGLVVILLVALRGI